MPETPPDPILRIETEMHTAPINRIDADAAGRFLVTGSDDKTVRVWDLESGELLRVLRPPIGPGDEGKVYAVAISADGETVAAGGWTAKDEIYLFERRTGRLRRRLAGLPNVVLHLTFDRDGERLAATVYGTNGIRVFRAADGKELARDAAYGAQSYWADFDGAGRLVTSSWDGHVRLYDRDLRLLKKAPAPGGKRPFGAAFSPDGSRVAVGYDDSTRVDVLSGDDLSLLYSADTEGTNTNLFIVAWSSDGDVLFAAGLYNVKGKSPIRRWPDAGRGAFRDLDGPRNTVMDLLALAGGRLVYGSQDPAWGVLDAAGAIVRERRPEIADHRGLLEGFRIDAAGKKIRFAYEPFGKRPAIFSLPDRRLVADPPDDGALERPRLQAPGVEIRDWEDQYEPRLNGKPLRLKALETSRALAVASDGESFLLGTEWWLRSFTREGEERWQKPVPGVAWAVNLSGDGRFALAAFADGTVRWFRARDGGELLAFFPHADGERWVLWTPGGYYDASVGGEELLGWHLNNGPDREAELYPAHRFRARFHRPDVIDSVLETLDEARAVELADAARPAAPRHDPVAALRPPTVTILAPAGGTEVFFSPLEVHAAVASPSGRPVTEVKAFVDGRPVDGIAVLEEATPTPTAVARYRLSVPLPPRDCTVAVLAETAVATSEIEVVKVRWGGPAAEARARLRVLAVGVSAYADPRYTLGYAAQDARDVAASWRRQEGGLYHEVTIELLTDAEASKDNILDGLERIERRTGGDDVAVLFLAGHGINDPGSGDYCFLPHEADLDYRRRTLLPGREIRNVLGSLRGKAVLFLDTCHAGAVVSGVKLRAARDFTRFINELRDADSGVVVYSASTGAQQSQERAEWGNGAFTEALVEGLTGVADLDGDRAIMIDELGHFLDRRVRALTEGLQTPTMAKPNSIPNFPIAMAVDARPDRPISA